MTPPTKTRGEEIAEDWKSDFESTNFLSDKALESLATRIDAARGEGFNAALDEATAKITEGIRTAAWHDQDALDWVFDELRALKTTEGGDE